jgi:hypothetical protein
MTTRPINAMTYPLYPPGTVIGKWTVLQYAGVVNKHRRYHCRCACGTTAVVMGSQLRRGKSSMCPSCAHRRGGAKRLQRMTGMDRLLNNLMKALPHNARYRDLAFTLSRDNVAALVSAPCAYCGEVAGNIYHRGQPSEMRYNGIDRVNSAVGYIPENCVPCCGTCNKMKLDYPIDAFQQHIERIYNHMKRRTP